MDDDITKKHLKCLVIPIGKYDLEIFSTDNHFIKSGLFRRNFK